MLRVHGVTFYQATDDDYGNPRYVIHYTEILDIPNKYGMDDYRKACKLANKIGGRKYTAKNFAGGIVFQRYNLQALADEIKKLRDEHTV